MSSKSTLSKANKPNTAIKRWYCLYTASRQEKKVATEFEFYNIDHYLPLITTVKQWSDRKKKVISPLFNGYIFVHCSSGEFEKILGCRGVVNFVRQDGGKAIVRDEEIATIKKYLELGWAIEATQSIHEINAGDRVKIKDGAFKDFEGDITHKEGADHFYVALEAIGQYLKIKLPYEILEVLDKTDN